MRPILYSRAIRSILLLAFWGFSIQLAQATSAPIYSNTGAPNASKVIQTCITELFTTKCYGSVQNPELATDASLETAATIDAPLLLLGSSSIGLRMDLAQQAPAYYRAGVVVSRHGAVLNLLGLNLAGSIAVRTYLKVGSSSQFQQQMLVSATLANTILEGNGERVRLEFVTDKPFDQVEIVTSSLATLGYKLDVHYAYAIDSNRNTTAKGLVTRFATPVSGTDYSTSVIKNGVTVCVNNEVDHPEWATDLSLTNHATFGTMANLSCPTTLRTRLEALAPAGYFAGFVVGSQSLLDVSALEGIRVTTYKNGVAQESATGGALLRLNVLPGGQQQVSFATTKEYDTVEITRTSLLSVLDNLSVYYGFGLEPRVFIDETPVLSNFTAASDKYEVYSNGLLCLLCANVENPERAANANTGANDYAEIRTGLLGGITSTALRLSLNGSGLAGNTAGVVLNQGTGLLNTQLLGGLRIKTYGGPDGNQLLETASGANLISQGLLADGRVELSFLTTQNFSRVELEVDNTLSLLDRTRVYYAFAEDRPTGFPTTITAPGPLPVELLSFQARAFGSVVNLTWTTASERNSSHFVVERSTAADGTFRTIGQVAAQGTSNQQHNYLFQDTEAGMQLAPVLYYRLRQVDFDGKESFSPVVAVSPRNDSPSKMQVYPNPATTSDLVRVRLLQEQPKGTTVRLYGVNGEQVNSLPAAGQLLQVGTGNLRAGLYLLVLTDATGRHLSSQRLVVTGH
ncbi:T9SS type A sorting domain-containing protein [Hymenobacter persicinus]|uniref:T9SS type A sorting domain-containing protein n=1 Tax=Hymenobacter persicinus TaxID=2025506 RepID=A0A4Q5LAS8_9BACT|nr:T9SS type A sorting domain-containing protein [Hymenobacter persicinus]RYU78086.1 T9SS type A sorting domain-containing protein [Hymenobacter persicinus]